jgi:chromosome segregation protein
LGWDKLYLKEVQMENFKSFGNKLSVPFFPGYTAITGPNGSGKSNIADAILFVLGPKSSKVMRAGKLTDLIFNGGKKHKNPAKYCKVSLVFDNKTRKMNIDSDEVVLTRMIKRAPIKNNPDNYYSYFYINGRSSSFSDFQNVLIHSRISGEGYNIVKQGDVTNITEMGGVDRRKIIDDIAGISNFDNDLKKADSEKSDVESNMDRINIILKEINNQIKQLKYDRDAAYRYKELKDQLYETKAKISTKKKIEIESQITEIHKQIESYEIEQNKLNEKILTLKNKYKESQEKLNEIEKKIGEVGGDEVKELKIKIDNLRSEEIKIEERLNYLNDEIGEIQKEETDKRVILDEIEKEITQNNLELEKLNNELNEYSLEFTEKEKELFDLKNSLAEHDDKSMEISHELTKMREEYNEKTSEIHELKLKRNRLTDKIENLNIQIAEIQETKSTYEFELKDIEWQENEFKNEFKDKKSKKSEIEKKLFEKKKIESSYSEQLNDLDVIIRKLQREQSRLQAEFDALQNVQNKYNRAVCEILKARNNGDLEGIHGTIAELANVDDKYKIAVGTAAGNRMQSIVVDNDETAAKAINFLQKGKLGRATFIPLNKMISGKPRGKALMSIKDQSSHGFAIDLIKFDKKYYDAFWYVFGDTVVINSLDDARRLMGGVRLVDLKGTLIESSGAMIGGSLQKANLSFTDLDRSKIEKITDELDLALKNHDLLFEKLSVIKKEILELENKFGEFRFDFDRDSQIKDIDIRKKEFKSKLELIIKELESKIEEKEINETKKQDIIDKIKEIENRIKEIDAIKEEKGKILLTGTKKQQALQVRNLENEVNELNEKILNINSNIETISKKQDILKERKDEIIGNIDLKNREIDNHRDSINNLKQSRSKYRDELKALMNVENQMTDKIKKYSSSRDVIYKDTISIENELDKINTRVESYYDLISRAKYRLPTLESSINELDEELKLYSVEIKDKNLPNIESLKDSIKVIEQSMNELEPVNMRALEEYEHQIERKKKLDEDVNHLKDQKKNLIKLCREITNKKTDRFFEVYDEINKNFRTIYSQLSEGGEGELKLEDPENIFENGLTIKAKPRGKKVLLLSALSGGEKSIASLAFIFAIQNYDPSPFYVLDEIDMFLDGVNAETVSRTIKNNSEDSQFIMVSLRKIALKEANHVYGVTMRDTGISDMIGNIDPSSVGPKGELKIGV